MLLGRREERNGCREGCPGEGGKKGLEGVGSRSEGLKKGLKGRRLRGRRGKKDCWLGCWQKEEREGAGREVKGKEVTGAEG
jgi:hypothetical protein